MCAMTHTDLWHYWYVRVTWLNQVMHVLPQAAVRTVVPRTRAYCDMINNSMAWLNRIMQVLPQVAIRMDTCADAAGRARESEKDKTCMWKQRREFSMCDTETWTENWKQKERERRTRTPTHIDTERQGQIERDTYGVATISRLLKIIGLFCKRAL